MGTNNWDEQFNRWKEGPGATETEKAENAVRLVTSAVREYEPLKKRSISVFAQGSYRNRTNVRSDSDVDVCVLCDDTFYFDTSHAAGETRESLGISPATYDFPEYKADIHAALIAKFGTGGVGTGDKAFDVHENSYRIAADVVPTFEGRDYFTSPYGRPTHRKGTVLRSERDGHLIYNYPEQHYDCGVAKHGATDRQFKKKVRILKRLRHQLIAEGRDVGKTTSSFLVESIVYNCPNACFSKASHYEDIRHVLVSAWEMMEGESKESKMLEVNGVKYLFHPQQPWTVEDAKKCVLSMWSHVGY